SGARSLLSADMADSAAQLRLRVPAGHPGAHLHRTARHVRAAAVDGPPPIPLLVWGHVFRSGRTGPVLHQSAADPVLHGVASPYLSLRSSLSASSPSAGLR